MSLSSVYLDRIASYVPESREGTLDRGMRFGFKEDFLIGKLGTLKIARKSPKDQASDLCVKAVHQLELNENDLDSLGALVVCTQTPDNHGIPHVSAIVQAKLNLSENCACFDISLGCSGYVYGLSIVTAFMHANGIKKGLFLTADPYSEIVDPNDRATALLFGDAATASLFTSEGGRWSVEDVLFGTAGAGGRAINNDEGKLSMNGQAVFNFAMKTVPVQVRALLSRNRLVEEDVDLFLFHQGSRYIVEKLMNRMNLPKEKVPIFLEDIGNTVSSAIPLTMQHCLKNSEAETIVVSGFGVGLSYGTVLLRKKI